MKHFSSAYYLRNSKHFPCFHSVFLNEGKCFHAILSSNLKKIGTSRVHVSTAVLFKWEA